MKTTTIRWPERLHATVADSAEAEGVTFAAYVREATIVRAAFDAGLLAGIAPGHGFHQEQTLAAREGAYRAAREWLERQG